MLSLWKLRVGVENYYIGQVAEGLDDYYTGHGESPGRWIGAASSGLGLENTVCSGDLQAVLAGLAPGTGLTPNGDRQQPRKGRVPGFDLTFSAPKSVSVLYALGDPLVRSVVVEATDRAVDEALAWLEREACFVRRGSNNRTTARGDSSSFGTRRLPGAGFVAAAFRHRTSRAGDPQLHTHVLVANITRGPDGRWTALDGQALYRSKIAAGAIYQTVLRDELTGRLGVSWGPVRKHTADIAGIPRRVLRLFSKRRNDIEDELERLGTNGPAAAQAATLATRTAKKTIIDADSLYEHWTAEAAAIGYGPADIDHMLTDSTILATTIADDRSSPERENRPVTAGEFADVVTKALVDHDSTFTRHDVIAAIADLLPDGTTARAIERLTAWVLAQPELVPLPHQARVVAGWEERWTSRRLLTVEADLLARYKPEAGGVGVVDPTVVDAVIGRFGTLGVDQADTVRRVTTQGFGVEVIVGKAGTGKTYTMNAVRTVFQQAGYTVVGAAPTARAARELADGARIEATTIAMHRTRHTVFGARHVVIVDEAAMCGTLDLHWIVSRARDTSAKVILVGDHHQLPEITAGGGFAAAVQTLRTHVAQLTINRRQQAEWEQDALDQLRDKNVHTAFNTYRRHGRVLLADTTDEIHTAAVAACLADHHNGHRTVLLTGTNHERRALNQHARAATAHLRHGPVLTLGDREFQAGDRILLLDNRPGQLDLDTGTPCRVDNGMLATITRIHTFTDQAETDSIDIQLDNGRNLCLTRRYVLAGMFDHGYAATIHKAQGITCDRTHVVGPAGLYREGVYVAMSRARHGSWLYATSRQAADLNEPGHTRQGLPTPADPKPDPELDIIGALQTSKAKQLATLQAENLAPVADLAAITPLDLLETRAWHIRDTITQLTRHGHTDPTVEVDRLQRAVDHRQQMHVGNRVKALDWDNIGTILAVRDTTGCAVVEFTTSDRHHHTIKTLPWADLQPIDHPEPVELTDDACHYLRYAAQAVQETRSEWNQQLAFCGIGPDEPTITHAAIEIRRQRVTHALQANPPAWLSWWLGDRPTDPAGAQVWDDELARLAAWRDHHHLTTTPGYGPQPNNPQHRQQWREHLDRSLTTRLWLTEHQPRISNVAPAPLDIVAVRERLTELDTVLDTAPPDQRRIIDAIHTGELTPDDINTALTQAAAAQSARRDWIIEHWPHVIEHAELARLDGNHDPLAHWPQPPTALQQQLYEQLLAISSDTPEPRTITQLETELDQADPRRQLDALEHRLYQLDTTINRLQHDLTTANTDQTTILHSTLNRLHEQRTELRRELDNTKPFASIWDTTGYRPGDLVDALNRRTNHLAHHALTNHEPWIDHIIRQWTQEHPDTDHHSMLQLQRLILDIAAHGERTGHTGPDPLAPGTTSLENADPQIRIHRSITDRPVPGFPGQSLP